MRTEIPALPPVSSSTTPRLTPASGRSAAAPESVVTAANDKSIKMAAAAMTESFIMHQRYLVRRSSASARPRAHRLGTGRSSASLPMIAADARHTRYNTILRAHLVLRLSSRRSVVMPAC